MALDDVPLDDKAKRMRDLLSSFYSTDPTMSANGSSKHGTLDAINTVSFDPDHYMNLLVENSNLEGLLQRHVEMAAEIKNLDTDLQMLVYENYNKFISATDTIKRMKNNIVGMEANIEQLLDKIKSVQSRSDGVNTSLFEKREHIEKLHRTRTLLRKVQFIYDLPARLGKCIKSEAYADAVRFYIGAMPIFKAYGDSSFQDCKKASEEAVAIIISNLQGKLFSDSESIQARAEAAVLLKQLDFPVDSLKAKLLEKLEQSIADLQLKSDDITNVLAEVKDLSKQENSPSEHEASVREFSKAIQAYRVIFPDSEMQLIQLSQDLIRRHFEAVERCVKKRINSADFLDVLRIIWTDVLLIDEVLHEAALPNYCLEAGQVAIKQYLTSTFSLLLHEISACLSKVHNVQGGVEEHPLQEALEASKKALLQGCMEVLMDFHQLLDTTLELLVKLRNFIIDLVQEGFQDFFRTLEYHFVSLSGRNNSGQHQGLTEGADKVLPGLVLVLAQLSVFTEQTAVPRVTEEIASSFSGGGIRGYENGPAFVPGEICRMFRSAGEKFLNQYVNMRTRRISILLRKRFTTPNWVKHKEPREVHMFVDLFLQELGAIATEVKQILPRGVLRRHHRSDSNGSTTSSRSNPLRDDKLSRSNTQRARSQLLETHLAKLFKQKVEIFTKMEYTQESVITTIVKLCLKSLQEYVRLQTFNRSGFQQIQLDIQFLRTPLKETVEDEAAVDFLLDEVIVGTSERCLDPIPLEPSILDKLMQAKLAKTKERNPVST
ncbi:Vps51/Vps67 family (components of vesicular transport) protein isoform 1 [Tripterygium wilfordii]|uniref:Vacuolar protein sorting-associated protein 51 homolog n=1 Tax=Tripterygium wilfordii TaxID=458696 RepID=A0A7J7DI06_TRIWF|nr:vacuolar protein sorting-associated protein 51 homolog isoform X2 [Tripterygium wilfordii]KAF5745919.1 Vps51/Vps67 family (components of vesicular transport) protein isoform 1 [Tripterygium wilfordii]